MPSHKLSLPAWFGDHMVLQQKLRIRIYGSAQPQTVVTIRLERFPASHLPVSTEAEYEVVFQETDIAEADGFFEFRLPMIEGSYDRYRLSVSSDKEKLVYSDILFGEVWLAAGGSNMAMPSHLTDVKTKLDQISRQPGLRFFMQNEHGLPAGEDLYQYQPQGSIAGGSWYRADQLEALKKLSAVAISFAWNLQKALHVPCAVFCLATPASFIHAWLPRQVIEQDALLKNHIREIRYFRDENNWNQLPETEKSAERYLHGRNQEKDAAAQLRAFSRANQPTAMFNHKLAPYTSLALRGILWYQGEEDVQYPDYYARALTALTVVFKEMFQSPLTGLNFIYSQLTPFLASNIDAHRLATFNEALSAVRRHLPLRAGMITNYDLPLTYPAGYDHYASLKTPQAKELIGKRMSEVALGLAYRMNQPQSAPECIGAEKVGNKLLLRFDNAGSGIRIRAGESRLKGFSICGQDLRYVLAEAKELYQVRVIVWQDEIEDPLSCAYAFSNFNSQANLCGSNGMPLVPFRLSKENVLMEAERPWTYCDMLQAFRVPLTDLKSPRMGGQDMPGLYPLWTCKKGRGSFHLETENKRQGNASILLRYQKADERPLSFGPVLNYASDYPPLDLHLWRQLNFIVFNAEHRAKHIRLALSDTNGQETISAGLEIAASLSWQTLSFDLEHAPVDLMRLSQLEFVLQDPEAQGSLYLDQITFTGYQPD